MVGGFVLDQMVTKWSRTFSYSIFWGPLLWMESWTYWLRVIRYPSSGVSYGVR